MRKVLLGLLVLLGSSWVWGDEGEEEPLGPAPGSLRAQCLQAFTALADDESSIYWNSAGIGREDDPKVLVRSLALPNITWSMDALSYKLLGALFSTKEDVEVLVRDIVEKQEEEALYGRMQFFPSITIGRFFLGLRHEVQGSTFLEHVENDERRDARVLSYVKVRTDGLVGLSLPFQDSGASFGLSLRPLFQAWGRRDFSFKEEKKVSLDEDVSWGKEGTAVAYDIGVHYVSSLRYFPHLGLRVSDVGNTLLQDSEGKEVYKIPMNVAIGTLWNYSSSFFHAKLMFDIQRIEKKIPFQEKLSMGFEVSSSRYAAVHPMQLGIGVGERGISGFVGLNLWFFHLTLASHQERVETFDSYLYKRVLSLRVQTDVRL